MFSLYMNCFYSARLLFSSSTPIYIIASPLPLLSPIAVSKMRLSVYFPLLALLSAVAVRACDDCVDDCSIMTCAEDVGDTVEYIYYCCANGGEFSELNACVV